VPVEAPGRDNDPMRVMFAASTVAIPQIHETVTTSEITALRRVIQPPLTGP
jgi:hypothetical protein